MLSIIVPAFNEEEYLPRLLSSLKRQGLKEGEYEIVVADAKSQDRTVEIALKSGCRVVKGGLPAYGKNSGGKAARGDTLFFIDADSELPDNCLARSLEEYKKRDLQVATFMLMPENKSKMPHMVFDFFYNYPILAMEKIIPHGAMAIMIEKHIFERLDGFDEKVTLAEDHHLTRRANKIAKYGILRSSKIYVCDRRFRKEGWLKVYSKYVLCEAHMLLIGPARSNIFRYKYEYLEKKKKEA